MKARAFPGISGERAAFILKAARPHIAAHRAEAEARALAALESWKPKEGDIGKAAAIIAAGLVRTDGFLDLDMIHEAAATIEATIGPGYPHDIVAYAVQRAWERLADLVVKDMAAVTRRGELDRILTTE